MMHSQTQFAALAQQPDSSPLEPSKWSRSRGKRIFDLLLALPLTVVSLPVMAVAAVMVKLTSNGPILFRQTRCGQHGRRFELLKFRSMTHLQDAKLPRLTPTGDRRVTSVGRALRFWKVDELPQLFNVLAGHMSLVGPRPDVPEYIDLLTGATRQVLKLRPGLTGWATLCFPNEAELLGSVPRDQIADFYKSELLPQKAQLDLEYGSRATMWSDVAVLLRTFGMIVDRRTE